MMRLRIAVLFYGLMNVGLIFTFAESVAVQDVVKEQVLLLPMEEGETFLLVLQ